MLLRHIQYKHAFKTDSQKRLQKYVSKKETEDYAGISALMTLIPITP